jgi:ribosomal protein S18 acetylase RimI-like enzyme
MITGIHAIGLATPEEARTIAEMSRDYIEQGLGWSWTGSRVLAAIRDRSANVAVVHERDRTIAFGIMQYGEQTAHLALLGVHAAHRQRGLGAAVLTWLEECADTAGIARIRLEARADNPVAVTFYLRQGYRLAGRIAGYYRGSLDALRLEKVLRAASSS